MSTTEPARAARPSSIAELATLDGTAQPVLAVGAVVVLTALVYRSSLSTLVDAITYDTPLAYVGLGPLLTAALLLKRAPLIARPPWWDTVGVSSVVIGSGALTVAFAIARFLPPRLGTHYWTARLDLLSLPCFLAGALTLAFGLRGLWQARFPLLVCVVTWPTPYRSLAERLVSVTTGTSRSLAAVYAQLTGHASAVTGSSGEFTVSHGRGSFLVSVASACSGASGVIGFAVVGLVVAQRCHGRTRNKVAWLSAGALLAFVGNVVRLTVIFEVGHLLGERAALDVLHPVLGLAILALVTATMVATTRLFGLTLRLTGAADRVESIPDLVIEGAGTGDRTGTSRRRLAIGSLAILALATPLTWSADRQLDRYTITGDALGASLVRSLTDAVPTVEGFTIEEGDEVTWARRYFGQASRWVRYDATALGNPVNRPPRVLFDLVTSRDRRSFDQFGIEQCYGFHHYDIVRAATVMLPGGVRAQAVTYRIGDGELWTGLWWIWRLGFAGDGSPTSHPTYERVLLTTVQADPADTSPSDRQRRVSDAQRNLSGFATDLLMTHFAQRPTT